MPPPGGIAGFGSGFSATIASVVTNKPATEAASCRARTTLVGRARPLLGRANRATFELEVRFERYCPMGCGTALFSMGQREGSAQPSIALKRSSAASRVPSTPSPRSTGVVLPSDLAASLKYLDNAHLQRLLEAVSFELDSRNQGASQKETVAAPSPRSTVLRSQKMTGMEEVPQAKANLIRASFQAGLKPAAIARTLQVPQSLVNCILAEKPKR